MNEDVESAEGLLDLVEEVVQGVQIAHVRFDEQGTAAKRLDFMDGFFSRSAVAEEVDYHIRAVAGKVQGDGAPDTAPRTGDQGNLILEEVRFRHGFSIGATARSSITRRRIP